MNEADLSDDAIIELAREGGVAWIPTLSGMRKIVVAQLNEQQKQRIAAILAQGKDDGEFCPELNVEAEAAILLGLLHGFGTAVLVGQMTADAAQANLTHQIDRLSR